MQGQRSSVSLPEILEFVLRSSSSTVGMDQDNFWNSMVLHPAETQNLPNYLLSPTDTDMPYVNMSTEAGSSSSIWNSGASSSAGHSLDMGDHDETKMELVSPASPIGGGPIEAGNMLSLDDVDINVSSTQIDDGQSFPFALDSNLSEPQNLEHNVGDEVSESELFSHPYVPSLLERDHGPSLFSSNSYGSSSGAVGFMSGDYGNKPGSSLDGRRLACKRKNIDGLPGQSSASGSANSFQTIESNPVHSVSVRSNANPSIHIASPSSYIPGASSSREQPNLRFSNITRGTALNSYPVSSVAGNSESSQRNFRLRISPAHQHDVYPPNLSSSRDTAQNSSIWLPNEPSSNFIPLNQRLETRPVASGSSSQNQPHASVIPGFPRDVNLYPRNAAPNSRNGSLSNYVNSTETLADVRDDTISRNTLRNDVSAHSSLFPTTENRNSSQDLINWNVASGSAGMAGVVAPTARAGLGSGVHSSLGPTWTPHQNPPTQISRSLVEAVHQTLFASVGSEYRGQSSNFVSQRPGQSSPAQEVGHQSGSVSRGNQQSHMRAALLMDRHSDNLSTLAFRESRNRIMSEIRNALNLMRRGERFEDVFMLDHPAFHGAADVRDRHRDMRLDVDNMSYEELLALEERIGNVSTGLCEETILKYLKQREHFSIGVGSTAETEPCCICQEEYVEGEDLGTLDCGHDFHTACIKQWLSQKNLCPICKTTGLVT